MIAVTNSLEPKPNNEINDDIKTIIGKYLKKVPDIESRYVINDKLSSIINHYFKGKISSLPLYKISLKIDRNPVKIPWTLDTVEMQKGDKVVQRSKSKDQEDDIDKHVKHYKVVKSAILHSSTEKPDTTTLQQSTRTPPPMETY